MQRKSSGGCGSTLFTLFLVFLILRVTGVIDWSWWWVTSPLWLPLALVIGGLAVAAVMGVSIYKISAAVLGRQKAKRPRPPGPNVLEGDVIDVEGSEAPASEEGGPPR